MNRSKPATFVAAALQWTRNQGNVTVRPAELHHPAGSSLPGLHIRQHSSDAWLVLPEAQAVDMATQILEVIETRKAEKSQP